MRGSPRSEVGYGGADGIIPAGAGLTRAGGIFPVRQWDHPRGCGAHAATILIATMYQGSSPRVRGSPCCHSPDGRNMGIIPAGAGLTVSREADHLCRWDHPRGCGAHVKGNDTSTSVKGSSPRVRGSLVRPQTGLKLYRIIPAGAGLTRARVLEMPVRWDHPRGCGAHSRSNSQPVSITGSSPRVRGSRCFRQPSLLCRGIIPAGAGLTPRRAD